MQRKMALPRPTDVDHEAALHAARYESTQDGLSARETHRVRGKWRGMPYGSDFATQRTAHCGRIGFTEWPQENQTLTKVRG